MKRFQRQFRQMGISSSEEMRELAVKGAKLDIVSLLLDHGTECYTRKGVVTFTNVDLDMPKGYVCDAMAVMMPRLAEELPTKLIKDSHMAYGLNVHIGNKMLPHRNMVWAHIDNVADNDIIKLRKAIQKACSPEGDKNSIINYLKAK